MPAGLLWSRPGLLGLFAAASLGRALAAAAAILLIREFLGGVLGRQQGPAGRLAEAWGPGPALWTLAIVLLLITLISAALTYASRITQQHLVKAVELRTLERLLRTLLYLPVTYHDGRTRGDLLQTVQQDVAHLRAVVLASGSLLLDALQAIALATAAIVLSPGLGLLAFVLLPLAVAPLYFLMQRIVHRSFGVRRRSVVLFDMMFQLLAGIRVLRIYQGEEAEARRVIDRARRYHTEMVAMERVRALARAAIESTAGVGLVIVIIVAGFQVLEGALGWPELLAFLMAVRASHTPLYNISVNVVEIQRHAASVAQIDALLATPHGRDHLAAPPLPAPRRLTVDRVSYSIGGNPLLHDVSFDLHAGAMLGIVGPSGAGKTTVLNLVAGLYMPDAGAVCYDGVRMREGEAASIHRHIALVTQDPFLFNTTIRENIRCGRPDATDQEIEAAARAASIHDEILLMPAAYDTIVGHGGREVSRGEAQRICIARALLKDAPILLLDEATSGLDAASEAIVQGAIDRLAEGRMTIAVTHDLSSLRRASRIMVLDRGCVVGLGTHEQLIQNCPAYQRLSEASLIPVVR